MYCMEVYFPQHGLFLQYGLHVCTLRRLKVLKLVVSGGGGGVLNSASESALSYKLVVISSRKLGTSIKRFPN